MTNITLRGEQYDLTPTQEEQIRAILTPKGKWVPKDDEKYFTVGNTTDVLELIYFDDLDVDRSRVANNNAFRTRQEAEREVLRRKGAERRYLPIKGEWYKTLSRHGCVETFFWDDDLSDQRLYHIGHVWHIDTPDKEIEEYYQKYKDAWEI